MCIHSKQIWDYTSLSSTSFLYLPSTVGFQLQSTLLFRLFYFTSFIYFANNFPSQIFQIAAHLVYWGKAIIIYPLCENNVYMLSPHANICLWVLSVEYCRANEPLALLNTHPCYCLIYIGLKNTSLLLLNSYFQSLYLLNHVKIWYEKTGLGHWQHL